VKKFVQMRLSFIVHIQLEMLWIGIAARITKVEHYPMTNPSYGIVTYKLLGRVVIERL